jgi:hypothetical protein
MRLPSLDSEVIDNTTPKSWWKITELTYKVPYSIIPLKEAWKLNEPLCSYIKIDLLREFENDKEKWADPKQRDVHAGKLADLELVSLGLMDRNKFHFRSGPKEITCTARLFCEDKFVCDDLLAQFDPRTSRDNNNRPVYVAYSMYVYFGVCSLPLEEIERRYNDTLHDAEFVKRAFSVA